MKNPNDKKNFGSLQGFKNLIVLAHDNGGKSGAFIDADYNEMRNMVATILKQRPDLREFLWQCVQEATGIVVPKTIVLK